MVQPRFYIGEVGRVLAVWRFMGQFGAGCGGNFVGFSKRIEFLPKPKPNQITRLHPLYLPLFVTYIFSQFSGRLNFLLLFYQEKSR